MALSRMQISGLVLALVFVAWFVMKRMSPSTQTADMVNTKHDDDMLVLRMHNQASDSSGSMFQLGINGHVVLARRDPTPTGKTYRIPLAKYGDIANISVVVFGTDLTIDEVVLRNKSILTEFVYSGSDLDVVTTTTRPAGKRMHDGTWNRSGVYVYIP